MGDYLQKQGRIVFFPEDPRDKFPNISAREVL